MSEAPKDAPAKQKSKMMLIIILAVVLLGGGAGGAYFFLKGKAPDTEAQEEAQRKIAMKNKVYVPLDPFTVNLADEKEARLAQVAMVFEVNDAELAEEIKTVMPTIRNRVLMILSSKQSKDLLSIEGKEQLAVQVGEAAAILVGRPPEPARRAKPKPKPKDETEEADPDDPEKEPPPPKKPAKAPTPLIRVNFSQFIVQ